MLRSGLPIGGQKSRDLFGVESFSTERTLVVILGVFHQGSVGARTEDSLSTFSGGITEVLHYQGTRACTPGQARKS